MATSAVSSSTVSTNTSTSTSAASSASKASSTAKTAASNIVKSLGAGSGIDINSLAQSLVDAEQAPERDRINTKISQTESRITGYTVMKYSLSDLKTAFSSLNDASDFNTLSSSNSQPSAFAVSTTAAAAIGNYSVAVTQLAREQRSLASFAATDTSLDTADFNLAFQLNNGTSKSISVSTHTPAGIVSAINNSADLKALGISAQLIDTGVAGTDRYKLVVSGSAGSSNGFSLTSDSSTAISFAAQQTATDAVFTVNGVEVTRTTNSVDDVVEGVTFNLYDATTGNARLSISRDTSAVKTKIQNLVTSYNAFVDSMEVLADPKSSVDTYGGILAGDSLLRSVRDQVRNALIANSSSPGSDLKALRDLGISFDRYGKLQITETKLDAALANHYDQVTTLFTANAENQSLYSTRAGGVAGDMVKKLDKMLRSTGLLALQTKTAQDKVASYNDDLTKLEDKMQRLLENYLKQFSTMESVVGESNSLRSSLQGTFDGMMASYTKG